MGGNPGRLELCLADDIVEVHWPDDDAVRSNNCVRREPVDLLEENV